MGVVDLLKSQLSVHHTQYQCEFDCTPHATHHISQLHTCQCADLQSQTIQLIFQTLILLSQTSILSLQSLNFSVGLMKLLQKNGRILVGSNGTPTRGTQVRPHPHVKKLFHHIQ